MVQQTYAQTSYERLVARYKKAQGIIKKLKYLYHRLYINYLKLKQYHNKKLKRATITSKLLLEQAIKEKYPLILDHRRRILHVNEELLKELNMSRNEFASSFYIDIMFEKFLPRDCRELGEVPIPEFHMPFLLEGLLNQKLHPFVHLGISGKRVYNQNQKVFVYYLSIRDISAEIELLYYQKTDAVIESLSVANVELQKAKKNIEAQKIMLISLVCSLMEEHSRETASHLQRIQLITSYLTEEIQRLNLLKSAPYAIEQYLKDIAYTSVLHDIGKVGVPQELIAKKHPLETEEFAQIKHHTIAGAAYIKKIINLFQEDPAYSQYIPFLEIPYSICLYHHERWDGSGYPKGLKGKQIPLPARIVAIADAYDAMRSDRPYNIPKSHREAVEEIIHSGGSQFDPVLVKVFCNIEKKLEELKY